MYSNSPSLHTYTTADPPQTHVYLHNPLLNDFTVAIVGGGIGGLALAISCVRRGIKVQVYEQAHAFAEIGAGVALGPNALRALSKIDPALEQGYQRCATENAWPEKKTTWFDFRVGKWPDNNENKNNSDVDNRSDTWHIVNVQSPPSGQSSVHRAHFLDEMVKLIPPGTAHFNKKLVDIKHDDDNSNENYNLLFADGSSATASLVVGCDGVKSRTRQLVLGEDDDAAAAVSPQFSGKYAYRGLIPMDDAVAALGEELARNSQMYFGPGGHILTFPIEKGATMNVVAFRSAARWDKPEWVLSTDHAEMRRDFAGWLEPAQRILALMQKADKWALFDHPPARTFYKGRLVLLGDAAHASTPHQGAGAGQAIEDALVLSELLRTWLDKNNSSSSSSSSGVPVEKVIAAYDAVRRPRSQKVVTTSRLAGMLYDLEHPECGSDFDKIRAHLLERFSWIWDEDLDEQIQVAVDMLS